MDTTVWPEKQHNNQNRVSSKLMMELFKGKEYANQLQTLLLKPYGDEGLVLAEELSQKILRSFTDSLAELSSCSSSEISQIRAPDHLNCQDSGDSKRPEVKYQRGCYKRKRAAESWVRVSATMEDGYAWRKYGQKDILNSKYPRCYFRCSHKIDQGCRATRQVQRIDQITIMYQTTYFGHHTCRDTTRAPHMILDSNSMESNQLSFLGEVLNRQYATPSNIIIPTLKQESKEETQSDLSDNKSSMDSSLWQDLIASESSEPVMDVSPKMGSYHEEVVSSDYTSASISLHGFDMNTFSSFADFNNHDFSF